MAHQKWLNWMTVTDLCPRNPCNNIFRPWTFFTTLDKHPRSSSTYNQWQPWNQKPLPWHQLHGRSSLLRAVSGIGYTWWSLSRLDFLDVGILYVETCIYLQLQFSEKCEALFWRMNAKTSSKSSCISPTGQGGYKDQSRRKRRSKLIQ